MGEGERGGLWHILIYLFEKRKYFVYNNHHKYRQAKKEKQDLAPFINSFISLQQDGIYVDTDCMSENS